MNLTGIEPMTFSAGRDALNFRTSAVGEVVSACAKASARQPSPVGSPSRALQPSPVGTPSRSPQPSLVGMPSRALSLRWLARRAVALRKRAKAGGGGGSRSDSGTSIHVTY